MRPKFFTCEDNRLVLLRRVEPKGVTCFARSGYQFRSALAPATILEDNTGYWKEVSIEQAEQMIRNLPAKP